MAVPPIPRGIEVLVKKAAIDPAFRSLLLEKRADAADEIGLELEASEVTMLNSIPADVLNQTIDQTTVEPESRAAFLGKAAAAMLAAVGFAGLLGGCDRPGRVPAPTGSRPQPAEEPERPAEVPPTKGVRPPPRDDAERPKEIKPTRGDIPDRPKSEPTEKKAE